MKGVATISQYLSIVDNLDLQSIRTIDRKNVSYHFEWSGVKIYEDIEEKPDIFPSFR